MPERAETIRGVRFRTLWAGQSVSALGDAAATLAVPYLVLQTTGSATATALAVAARTVSYLVVGLLAGPLVDRSDPRRMMITADVVRVAGFALLPLVVLLPGGGWLVLPVVVVLSGAGVFFETALTLVVKDGIADEELAAANSRLELSTQAGLLAGPALVGVALATTGVATVLCANALTFVVSVLTLLPLRFDRTVHSGPTGTRSMAGDLREGVRYIRSHRLMRTIIGLQVVINFVVAAENLLILYVDRGLHASPAWLGVIIAAAGVGGIAAGAVAGALARRFPAPHLIAWSVIGIGGSLLGMALARTPLQLCLVNAVHGALTVFATINIRTVRQRVVPRELLGRVTANARTIALAANPLGALLFGLLAQANGNDARIAFLLAGVLSAASTVVAWRGLLGRAPSG